MPDRELDEGHVRLHRQVMRSDLWLETPATRIVGFTLMMLAEWRPEGQEQEDQQLHVMVHVPRGHVLVYLNELSRRAAVTWETTKRAFARLQVLEFAVLTSTTYLYYLPRYDFFNPLGEGGLSETREPPPGGVIRNPRGGLSETREGGSKKPDNPTIYETQQTLETQSQTPPKPLVLTHPKPPRRCIKQEYILRVLNAHSTGVESELGITPTHTTADREQARQLVIKYGVDDAEKLAAAWPTVNAKGARQAGYPMRWLPSNIDAVRLVLRGDGGSSGCRLPPGCADPNDPGWDKGLR